MSRVRCFLLLFILSACRSPAPIRIGVVLGDEGVAGAQMAADEINASGGIRGRPLALWIMSNGEATTARPAIVSAESLSNDASVIAVVGHSNSSASLAASQIYNARSLVQIAPTSSAPLLSHAGRYTFRLVASDIHQARFLADVMTANGATPRVAMFFVNDDYGRALEQEVHARLTAKQVPIVYESPYSQVDAIADEPAVVRALSRSQADILVWLGRAPQLVQLLPAIRRAMPRLRVLASDGIDNVATKSGADSTLLGVRYVSFLDMSAPPQSLSALRQRVRSATGMPLAFETALSYDAVMLLATAARDVGPGREAIRAYLASLGHQRSAYPGATGPIAFDSTGGPAPSYVLVEVTSHGTQSTAWK